MRNILFLFCSIALPPQLIAQWVGGGSSGINLHHQACAFHDVDTGIFVYGSNDPGQGEGGVIVTWSGLVGSGGTIWYASPGNLEDVDVKIGSNGRPFYLVAGHEQYNKSLVLHPYLPGGNALQFDSVRTGTGRYYRAIRMRSDIVAFAAGGDQFGNGIIDMSIDTGYTWSNIAVLPGQPVSRLHFVDDQLGFAATGGYRRLFANGVNLPDSGAIYRTTDGGLNWMQVYSDTATGFSDVAFSSTTNGVATRNDGVILRTTDGGNSWSPAVVSLGATVVMTSVTFRGDGVGFAAGYRADGVSGYILISTDDGVSWSENFSTGGFNHSRRIYDLYFFDDAHGYAGTHVRPLRTTGIVMEVGDHREPSLTLFPNPASDVITVETTNGGVLEVLDAIGAVVMVHRITQRTERLDVGDLAPGPYIVRTTNDAVRRSARFVRM